TEEALRTIRQRRDEGWRLVKADWLDQAPRGKDLAAFLAEFAPEGSLAAAYEHTVQRGDALADRLHREADRVARKAEWLAQLDHHRTARAALERELRLLDDRRAALDRDWNTLVAPLGVAADSLSPPELRAWLRRRDDVLQLLEKQ